jgi:uncharacterized protein
MTFLLDVNLLIALAWPTHVAHRAARRWFGEHSRSGWATCPATQSGFVRISSNPKVVSEAKSPSEATALLSKIAALPGHSFWTDDIAFADSNHLDLSRIIGYRQVADAHLLALALRHKGKLATFDRGIQALVPRGLESRDVLEILFAD